MGQEKLEAVNAWGRQAETIGGGEPPGEVVPFPVGHTPTTPEAARSTASGRNTDDARSEKRPGV
jgi:hypothetical protein